MNDFKGVHHYYLGLVLILVAFVFIWINIYVCLALFVPGQWLIYDDFYQHFKKRKNPEYRSPVNRLFGLIYKFKIIQKITSFFDRIFGRKQNA